MRLERSFKNSMTTIAAQTLITMLSFVTRIVFLQVLNQEYLGVNALLGSILSLLMLSELGIGTAITYALYKPIEQDDQIKISAIMNLFAKAYRLIAIVVAVAGIMVFPFLKYITGDLSYVINLPLIYFLLLFNTVIGYFFSYKRILISANQQEYINAINQSVFLLIQNILQIILLIYTRQYIIYLLCQICCTVACNITISNKANRLYPFLKANKAERVDQITFKSIKKNVSAMLMHQIGSVVVTGTDMTMIAWVDINLAGIYSNYLLITQTVINILRQAFQAITASVGSLVASEGKDRQHEIYLNLLFANFWIFGFCTIAMAILINPFIGFIAGESYVLPYATVMLIGVNFFLMGMRQTNFVYINAAGIFWNLRYKSLVESAINLVASLTFIVYFDWGLNGVLLGTLTSNMLTNFWWEPYAIYKHHFEMPPKHYIKKWIGFLTAFVAAFILTNFICIKIDNSFIGFVIKFIMCIFVPNIVFFVIFFKSNQFKYFCGIARKMINRLLKRGG